MSLLGVSSGRTHAVQNRIVCDKEGEVAADPTCKQMDPCAPARPGTTISCPSLMPCYSAPAITIVEDAWCRYHLRLCLTPNKQLNKLHGGGNMFRLGQPAGRSLLDLLSPCSPLVRHGTIAVLSSTNAVPVLSWRASCPANVATDWCMLRFSV